MPSGLAVRVSDADRHLLGGYAREQWQFRQSQESLDVNNYRRILSGCPRTVHEKADKLLAAIHRQTKHFGQEVCVMLSRDYRLAYAQSDALLDYLIELGFIRCRVPKGPVGKTTDVVLFVVVKAPGVAAIESRLLSPSITVFVSSTCCDLVDLRAELADFLESKGFIVRISDDPNRFDVDPTIDSIQSCLRNVEEADVVLCIVDRRYGPRLPPDNMFSATHVEVKCARERGKPVYAFGRDRAFFDFDQPQNNPNVQPRWVAERRLGKNAPNGYSSLKN